MAKHNYYFSTKEAAIEFMKSVPIEIREDVKVCFPIIDSDYWEKTSSESVTESLRQLIKGSDEPLTEQRIKEIFEEIEELIHQWPQLRVL